MRVCTCMHKLIQHIKFCVYSHVYVGEDELSHGFLKAQVGKLVSRGRESTQTIKAEQLFDQLDNQWAILLNDW